MAILRTWIVKISDIAARHYLLLALRTCDVALCPYRKSNPDVLMMQSSQERLGNDAANGLDMSCGCRQLRHNGGDIAFVLIFHRSALHLDTLP